MTIEQTLVLIKPDGVALGYTEDILGYYLRAGLQIVSRVPVYFTEDKAKEFYRDHKGRPYFFGLVKAMSCGPALMLILEGEDAIAEARRVNGVYHPDASLAAEGTIRHDFKSANGPFNTAHSSDSKKARDHEEEVALSCQI